MSPIWPTTTISVLLVSVLSFSTTVVAQEREIRQGTALARLVAEITAQAQTQPMIAAAAAPSPGAKFAEIPSWLRAHYRRNHPEMQTAAAAAQTDPTGGYPLVLENLYAWMLLHQDLEPSPAPAFKAAVAPSAGLNRKISGESNAPHSESDIRINFIDPTQIIAASNNIGNGRQAQFFSADGGATWGQTTLPLLSGDALHSDPTVDWTSDGTAWATTIGIDASTTVLQLRAYKSVDGGKTWVFDSTFSGDQTSADKQLMWVDRSKTSPFRDNIYVIWHNGRPAFITRRTSSGWQVPIKVSGAETTGTAIGSDITTNGTGDVFAVWPDTGSRNVFFVKSTNGGVNFSSPVPIAKTLAAFQISVPAFARRAALVGASIVAIKDDVYVSYVDLSGESGCTLPMNEPGDDSNSTCKSRIWFISSHDRGTTWSEPQQINPEVGNTDQFNQRLAVDPDSGALGIIYYNTGADVDRIKTNVVFQLSTDGGTTWGTPTTVTDATTDETTVDADLGNQYGDYNGLSVVGETFFPSWTDRRDGTEAIFTAKIMLEKIAGGIPQAALVPGG